MTNERTLNVKVPDKLYMAMKKAANQKSISLAALTRMLCSDWIMAQSDELKNLFMYPERLLAGLTGEERKRQLDIVANGGFSYNQYGEACFDAMDDNEADEEYAGSATPEEIEQSIQKMHRSRGLTNAGD